jgi:hypothetical protein
MNIQSFTGDLEKFAKASKVELEVVIRKVAFEVYTGITQKTPVDTGRAKGNWNIGLSNIDYTVNENATSSVKGQAGYENLPREGAGNKVIYITNNLPYINVLENGSSKQAPNGMVSLTMQDVQRSIRNVIR